MANAVKSKKHTCKIEERLWLRSHWERGRPARGLPAKHISIPSDNCCFLLTAKNLKNMGMNTSYIQKTTGLTSYQFTHIYALTDKRLEPEGSALL